METATIEKPAPVKAVSRKARRKEKQGNLYPLVKDKRYTVGIIDAIDNEIYELWHFFKIPSARAIEAFRSNQKFGASIKAENAGVYGYQELFDACFVDAKGYYIPEDRKSEILDLIPWRHVWQVIERFREQLNRYAPGLLEDIQKTQS